MDRSGGWNGWEFFRDYLGVYDAGVKEAQCITQALQEPGKGYRREVLDFLISPQGQALIKEEKSERVFHRALMKQSKPELKDLLGAIMVYETFCRLLEDTFFDSLYVMTQKAGRTRCRRRTHRKHFQPGLGT